MLILYGIVCVSSSIAGTSCVRSVVRCLRRVPWILCSMRLLRRESARHNHQRPTGFSFAGDPGAFPSASDGCRLLWYDIIIVTKLVAAKPSRIGHRTLTSFLWAASGKRLLEGTTDLAGDGLMTGHHSRTGPRPPVAAACGSL